MKTLARILGCLFFALTISFLAWAEDKPDATKPADKPADKAPEKPADKAPEKSEKKKEDAKPADTKPAEPAADPAKPAAPVNMEAIKKFEEKFSEWKQVLKELRALQLKAQGASADDLASIQKQWDGLIEKGNKFVPELRQLGKAAYVALPNGDRELSRFLAKLSEDEVARDDYDSALDLTQTLIDNGFEDKSIYAPAGVANYATGHFDKAEEYLKIAFANDPKLAEKMPAAQQALSQIPSCKQLWVKEQELRKAEAEKNDLPRVKLSTSKGDIVIELFENEAPETVANFISLVESKFYDNKTFHRVLPGFMAQGGCPKGDGTGGPGYNIYCECYKPEARMHFQGSLSMAHAGRDTGGSQFFLTFLPTTNLNGRHTVFGRVIEGMDVLAKIQRIDPQAKGNAVADKIVTAEVLRKRDHKYEPNKVK